MASDVRPSAAVTVDLVVLAVRDDELQVLMVRRGKAPYAGRRALPGGFVEADEDLLEAARRELLEETGVEAAEWRELARLHLSNSVSDELAILFLATGLSHGDATPEGTEQLIVRWLPFAEVLAMTLDGRITDAMTVVAVERLALLRTLEPTRG
jgi:ADP-ribose pyrophosphatase YjhB (NUDIX family)